MVAVPLWWTSAGDTSCTVWPELLLSLLSTRILWSVPLGKAKGVGLGTKIIVEPWQCIWFGCIKMQLRLERSVWNTSGEFGWMKELPDPAEPGEVLTQSVLAQGIPVFLEFLSPWKGELKRGFCCPVGSGEVFILDSVVSRGNPCPFLSKRLVLIWHCGGI